jgi:UDP-N-acetylglucosamine 2-epimerase (hydrolysing)|tara:strand:+ start:331 stop:1452 length:1122 start_codon:yes stop_codon:yes gene_type:complete
VKKIIFVTATRADYGKLKTIIISAQKLKNFRSHVFVTGMHNIREYGSTYEHINKDKIKNVKKFTNQKLGFSQDKILSNTIDGFSKFTKKIKPDLVIIHGDRIEPLGCAIVCCLNNIKIAHFEGGELSGTVDEIFRHSISKLCNIHFVTNKTAKKRLIQLGELNKNVFITGSPDVDMLLDKNLPSLETVNKKYNIKFDNYSLAIFHPVTTDIKNLKSNIKSFVKALNKSNEKFILIYPNNDLGSKIIIEEYKMIKSKKIKIFPSIRFEYYLTLLKNCKFIVGNSSSGIIEAPYYGVPTINVGDRQKNRAHLKSIINCNSKYESILRLIKRFSTTKRFEKSFFFGLGKSNDKVMEVLKSKTIWKLDNQKQFKDII